jgi:signal transduction histidine kinase
VRVARLLVWLAGGAFAAALIAGAIDGRVLPTDQAVAGYAAAFAAVTIGVVAWQVRPESRVGLLVVAIVFAGMSSDLSHVYPTSRLAVTVGLAASWLAAPLIAQVVLSYPSGRLSSRPDRIVIATAWLLAVGYGLVFLLFYDPRAPVYEGVWSCPWCTAPYTHVAWHNLIGFDRHFNQVVLVLALVLLGLFVRKLVRTGPGGRRVVLPLAVAACFIVVEFGVQMILYGHPVDSWTDPTWFWIVSVAMLSVPVALAVGLLWQGGGRGAVAALVVELERTPPGGVRDALARTLGDPTLELALWLPDRSAYVDAAGRPVTMPGPDSGRAITVLGPEDSPVAAIVHDPILRERHTLLASAGAAVRLALENERLQAELRAQLAELHASRQRIVAAGDEERRKLERDLHDGAQQRLLSIGLALQLARAKLGPDANGATELLAEADQELRATLDELRELARGIHPAVLTERGLAAALRSLADRAPVPVTVAELPDERLPAATEAAAYFLVSEALANVAKHARASRVRVSVTHTEGQLLVEVDDDGVGGADPGGGSGLRGLADRVHALDGRLRLESRPGQGTTLHAEIPCG